MGAVDERRRWSESADAWGRWAEQMAEPADRINWPLLDLAGVNTQDRVLDLATGAGEPWLGIAARVGPGGLAVGSDLVPAMLAHAAARARAKGLPERLTAADMARLPFADGTFGKVVCRFGLMFVSDPVAAASEMRRILLPGGVAAFAVWGPLAENTLFGEILSTLDARLGPDPSDHLAPLFRFATEGALTSTLAAAGLRNVVEQSLRLDQRVPADRPFWRATLEMGFTPRLMALHPAERAAVEQSIADRFAALAEADGCVPVAMHVRLARALRP